MVDLVLDALIAADVMQLQLSRMRNLPFLTRGYPTYLARIFPDRSNWRGQRLWGRCTVMRLNDQLITTHDQRHEDWALRRL